MTLYATAAPSRLAAGVSRNFAADENCLEAQTASDSFDFAIFDHRHPKPLRLVQRAENRVRREHLIENPRCAIEPHRLRLAERKQAGDVIELRVTQQNRVDRRSSHAARRQQVWK